MRNKQKHGLEDYEMEALGSLRKNLAQKWDFVTMQADEQARNLIIRTRCDVRDRTLIPNRTITGAILILSAQVRISKERKKVDKMVADSQERAFWRVLRPPPGAISL